MDGQGVLGVKTWKQSGNAYITTDQLAYKVEGDMTL